MPYLVDGHNLIPHVPGLSLSALDDELMLIELLQDFCRERRKKVEVYFDRAPHGFQPRRSFGQVSAVFVPTGMTADQAIRNRLLALGKAAAGWSVVTSDHQVQAEARAARAHVIESDDFSRQLVDIAAKQPPQKRAARLDSRSDDLQEWLKLFGVDEADKSE